MEYQHVDDFYKKVEYMVISKLVDQIVHYRSNLERAREAYNKKQEELRHAEERKQKEAILSKLIPQDEDSRSKGFPSPKRPSSPLNSKRLKMSPSMNHIHANKTIQKPLSKDPILRRAQSHVQQLTLIQSKSGSMAHLRDEQEATQGAQGKEEGVFYKVQRHPEIFKIGSVARLRKKMQRTVVREGHPLDFDNLKDDQRDKLGRILSDKYAPREQRKIYNICLNYKQDANNPLKKDYFFTRTKEYMFRNLEELQQEIWVLEAETRPGPRMHRKTSSLSTFKMRSLIDEKADLGNTLKRKSTAQKHPTSSDAVVRNFSEIFQRSSKSIPNLLSPQEPETQYTAPAILKPAKQAYNLLGRSAQKINY